MQKLGLIFTWLIKAAIWVRENAWHIVAPLLVAVLQWMLSRLPVPRL